MNHEAASMDKVLLRFIKALRQASIELSSADAIEALKVAALVGYRDRQVLKDALGLILAKTIDDKQHYELCFEQFFTQQIAITAPNQESLAEEQLSPAQDSPKEQAPPALPDQERALSPLANLLAEQNQAHLQLAIRNAAEAVGLSDIQSFTQQGLFSRRMLMNMGLAELQEDLFQLEQSDTAEQHAQAKILRQYLEELRGQIRDQVERQFLLFAGREGEKLHQEFLQRINLNALEKGHLQEMRQLIRQMAQRLLKKHKRRQKRQRRGQLDLGRTLRHNLAYDGNLIDLRWRTRHKKIPKLFVLCDISGSMSQYARFFLLFLYSLNEVLRDIEPYVFSTHASNVGELFRQHDAASAIEESYRRWGNMGSDYGQALEDFHRLARADMRQNSIVIFLGDARNNHGDPRTDILRDIYQRCGQLIWLNPERPSLWQSGDSEMLRYAGLCHHRRECRTLRQLADSLDDVLKHYS